METAYNWLHSHTHYQENEADVAVPAADVQVSELRGEGFAKATWTPSPQLNVEAGLREEVSHIASTGDEVLAKTAAPLRVDDAHAPGPVTPNPHADPPGRGRPVEPKETRR